MKDTFFSVNNKANLRGELRDISTPQVMGILNATDDSFYADSRILNQNIDSRVERMISEKPDIIDIGGQSTRPGAVQVDQQKEIDRVLPVIEKVKKKFDGPISIDTFNSEVAEKAIKAGASIINDVMGGAADSEIFAVAGRYQTPYILMHTRGTPANMHPKTNYDNLILDLQEYFSDKIQILKQNNVNDIILDPGFGFAKTAKQNLELLRSINHFRIHGCPILIGVSRKSTVQKLLDVDAQNALHGTSLLNYTALQNGAQILRVHDVKAAKECIKVWGAF